MTVQGLLGRLHAAEVRLRKKDGDLLISGRRENVDAQLLDGLRIHKAALLAMIGDAGDGWWSPPRIRPEAFPLADLDEAELELILERVPGGASNVQDIYPLAPLQEGILFHHLMDTEKDTYLLEGLLRFDGRELLDSYIEAMRSVIARHDILRTSILWEGLREPVQVVWREAHLRVEEVEVDPAEDAEAQLYARYHPRHYRLDLREAPIMRGFVAADTVNGGWLLLLLRHHVVSDHTTMSVLRGEIQAHLEGRAHELPTPLPFRNYVAQARMGASREEHAAFFRELLGDVDEPTAPYGMLELRADWSEMRHARLEVEEELGARIRERSRLLGVSSASLCHLAWALLLARVSGRDDVVFGTVLVGRMQGGEGTDRVMGPFINTLPIRVRDGQTGAEEAVRAMQLQLAGLMRHEHASLALAQRASRVQAPTPLFSALFNYRHSGRAGSGGGTEGMRLRRSEDRTNYPFNLAVDDFGDRLRLMAEVQPPADAEAVCAMMHRALEALVAALEAEPSRPIGSLDVLPPAEQRRVVEEFNATGAPFPDGRCVHQLFEEQVRTAPDAPAVVFPGGMLTYGELNRRANRLAHHLRALGVGPDSRVAIHVQRGPEMIVGVVAVLKAGGAYVPLDPSYPPERLRYMLEDSRPAVVLTQESLAESRDALLDGIVVPAVSLDALPSSWDDEPETDLPLDGLTPAHLAWVIYTSGSTGRPKGVMVAHRGACNLVTVQAKALGATRESRILQFASFSFDGCAFEIVMALGHGASLHLLPAGEVPVGEALTEVVESQGVTHAIVPPPVLAALPESTTLPSLRTLASVGDVLPPAVQARWGKGRRFINGYGPTEATVATTTFQCGEPGAESPPIGGPVPNARVYILDAAGRPTPVGVVGELHVGGVGLARGYLNRPAMTAERFVPDALGGRPGGRLYRTGDLGRWLPDGVIEFAGRNDAQVKVRGFRIELGEIEARLADHAGVREAVVLVRDDGAGKRLVAYYVGDAELDAAALRAHLSERLPEYLVPAAFVRLDALPLTPNGKVDRRGLPAPDAEAWAAQAYEPPVGEAETALAEIWSELLGVERVGRRDNFFELGGHSLSAVTLVERMRRRGLHCEVRALFNTPTLAELAAQAGGESHEVAVPANLIPDGCRNITPEMLPLVELDAAEIGRIAAGVPGGAMNVQDIYPLAPLQEGMLFHHLLTHERDPYVTRVLGSFDTRGELDAYLDALQQVIARHDILRTAIVWEGLREPVQVVWRQARLEVEEIELDPNADAEEELYARFDPREQRVDVRRAPMLRAWAARDVKRGRWLLLELRHHLSGDHTTLAVMKAEVRAILAGQGDRLAAPLPFRNYVAQARLGISRDEHEAFFRELLGDVSQPTAPFGLLDAQGDGSGIERGRLQVDSALAARLRERARALGVSAASICHVAWGRVLARTVGRDDVVFGTLLFGRMGGGAGADRVMGLFINTLPVRVRDDGAGAVASVRAMHAQLAELLRHEHAPLALAQRCSGVEAPAPLFTSLLNYRHTAAAKQARAAEPAQAAGGMRTLRSQERTNYPVVMAVDDLGDFLGLTSHAPASLGPDRLCALMHRALEGVVAALESAPERPARAIDVLPDDERRTLVETWNATAAEYPSEACLHELFELRAERAPDAVAVEFEGGAVTYAELNARANRLARHLRTLGVGPDTRVAIAAERSPEMVAGLLAVLKAGGAYVPLDPEYPADRLDYMLEDSAPAVLLTQRALEDRFADFGVRRVLLDADPAPWAAEADANPERRGVTADHLAYVIYTSGSTGRPKGVMNLHRNVANRLCWGQSQSRLGAGDAVLQGTSLSFDVATREIFWALLAGARLVLPTPRGQRDPAYLAATIRERGITTLNLVPSLLQVLVEEPEMRRCTALVRIVCSGEALPAPVLAAARERLPWAEITNIYGPSEAATGVGTVGCEPEPGRGIVAIGRPTANVRAYVLDAEGRIVPIGVEGELYLGGHGVARGYHARPALTAERFVPDPFGAAGERLYRTGDLARWRADGTLEFLGRNDQQVKVRGFRIETGEIEALLSAHPAVREAAVVAREDTPGDRRLVAYVAGEVDFKALRTRLAARLPEYMVPAAFVRLDEMPRTPNGKLDRRALPAPGAQALSARGYEAPADEMEEELAAIWADVLGAARVGRHDHFFELGGHSLLAVKMVSRVRQELDIDIPLGDVFEHPTLAAFAQQVVEAELAQFDPGEIARLAALLQETGD